MARRIVAELDADVQRLTGHVPVPGRRSGRSWRCSPAGDEAAAAASPDDTPGGGAVGRLRVAANEETADEDDVVGESAVIADVCPESHEPIVRMSGVEGIRCPGRGAALNVTPEDTAATDEATQPGSARVRRGGIRAAGAPRPDRPDDFREEVAVKTRRKRPR